MSENKDMEQEVADKETNEGRREALKKLGKYAYTAPVVLSLLAPKSSNAQLPSGPPAGPNI